MALVRVLYSLPAVVLRRLDAWSYQVALRKQRERQQRWLRRTAVPAVQAPAAYRLQPWRD